MLNFAGTPPHVTMPDADSVQLIAADLRGLISQIETSMRRIATAMDQEHGSDPEGSADVFVLDDVTPRYATASAALDACRAGRPATGRCRLGCRSPACGCAIGAMP